MILEGAGNNGPGCSRKALNPRLESGAGQHLRTLKRWSHLLFLSCSSKPLSHSFTHSFNKHLCCDTDLQEGLRAPPGQVPLLCPPCGLSHTRPLHPGPSAHERVSVPSAHSLPIALGGSLGGGEAGCLSSVRLLCGEVSSPWCLLCGVHGPLPGGRVPGG